MRWEDLIGNQWLLFAGAAAVFVWLGWPHLKKAMRSWRRLSDNHQLIVLVLAVTAAVTLYFGWPYVKRAMAGNGHQMHRTSIDVPWTLDPSRVVPRGGDASGRHWQPRADVLDREEGDTVAPPGRHLRLPPGSERWRYCTTNGPGHVQHCGRWHAGPAPEGA